MSFVLPRGAMLVAAKLADVAVMEGTAGPAGIKGFGRGTPGTAGPGTAGTAAPGTPGTAAGFTTGAGPGATMTVAAAAAPLVMFVARGVTFVISVRNTRPK